MATGMNESASRGTEIVAISKSAYSETMSGRLVYATAVTVTGTSGLH